MFTVKKLECFDYPIKGQTQQTQQDVISKVKTFNELSI